MRKLCPLPVAIAVVLLIAAPTAGQVRIGVAGGLNLASLLVSSETDEVPDFESVTRMSIGVSATMPISERWAFQLAGGYSQRGGKGDLTEENVNIHLTLNTDYYELAGLGVMRFPLSGDRVSAHLLAGPALALEASCDIAAEARVEGTSVEINEACDAGEFRLDISSFDLGLVGGGGIEIGASESVGVSLGARYNFGLLDLDDSERDVLKHRGVSLRAGLVFSIG
ncbi:MAG: porin family protein [Gemmatimonadota bacterium]|nr:porin family protein [Gemmatimonadota bacterium]